TDLLHSFACRSRRRSTCSTTARTASLALLPSFNSKLHRKCKVMSNTGIFKNPSAPQVEPAIIARLRSIAVALLSDQLHRNCGSVGLTPYHSPAPMAGTAVTVKTRGGDNLAILRAYDFC